MYIDKYLKGRIETCTGPVKIPTSYEEARKVISKGDLWDENIACVMSGHKLLALTDYYPDEDPDALEDYYNDLPKDSKMREYAKQCEHISILYQGDKTSIWYLPKARRNAEMMAKIRDIKILRGADIEIFRSLLLGYTPASIITYIVYHLSDAPRHWKEIMAVNLPIISQNIEYATEVIHSQGGIVYGD